MLPHAARERALGFVRRHRERLELALVTVALAMLYGPTLVEHARLASDRFRFADDVRILIPPLYRAEDPALFPNDPVVDYYLAGLPDAHRLLYSSLAPMIGPEALSKVLPYVLLAVALGCLAFAARRLGGNAAMLGALALALGSAHVLGRMVGGLPRAFALPLLLAGALCLVAGRPIALAACAVIAAAFYPVAGLLLGLSLFGLLVLPAKDRGHAAGFSLKRRVAILALTASGMVLAVLPAALRLSAYGPAIAGSLAGTYPEAGPYGRFDPMDRPPFPALPAAALEPLVATLVGDGARFTSFAGSDARDALACAVLALLAVSGWVFLARRRVEARRVLVLAAAVVVAHTVSLFVSPHLFLPERYVAYGIPTLALLGIPSAFSFLSNHERRALRWVPLGWNLLVLALVGARGASWSGLPVLVPPAERPLYQAIARLPSDAMVAGFPGFAIDNVPYLSRRSAFVTRETHMPFHSDFTNLMRRRMRAFVAAYFATERAPLSALRDEHGVTHVIVDQRHFESAPPYFAPFGAEVERAFERGKEKRFVLVREFDEIPGAGSLRIVDLSRL